MLVQELEGSFRLIRQQDHARLSGIMAMAWRSPATGSGLPYRVVWATGVHDAAWTELDRRPEWNPDSGRPFDFHRLPLSRKLTPYRRGIDRVAELDSYAGFQVSRHYCSFLDAGDAADFLAAERERRHGLREELPPPARDSALLDRELAYLKLFDTLSLYACLAAPGPCAGATRPGWLVPDDRLEPPEDGGLSLSWRSDEELAVEPSPFPGGLELHVPYREVPRDVGGQEGLDRAWTGADLRHETIRLSGDGG